MNAIATPVTGNRWFRTFHWLLRREYWENRGGFLAQSRFQWKRFMSDGEHGAKGDGVDA